MTLVGELGAGKTVFAKGLAEGLGIDPDAVSSPTFVLAQELPTKSGSRLVHADFYRIEDPRELETAGLDDWLESDVFLLVEWGERFPEMLPADRVQIRIEPGDAPEERRIQAEAGGVDSNDLLEDWRKRCP